MSTPVQEARRGGLWLALVAAPAAWLGELWVTVQMQRAQCNAVQAGHSSGVSGVPIYAATAVAAAIVVAAMLTAYRHRRQYGDQQLIANAVLIAGTFFLFALLLSAVGQGFIPATRCGYAP